MYSLNLNAMKNLSYEEKAVIWVTVTMCAWFALFAALAVFFAG
jgi:hypothetical protein